MSRRSEMELLLLCLSLWILQHSSADADSIIHIGKHPIQTRAENSRNALGDRLLRNVALVSCNLVDFGVVAGRCYKSYSLSTTLKSCRLLCELCLVVRQRRRSSLRFEPRSSRRTTAVLTHPARVWVRLLWSPLSFHKPQLSPVRDRHVKQAGTSAEFAFQRCGAHRGALSPHLRPHQPVSPRTAHLQRSPPTS